MRSIDVADTRAGATTQRRAPRLSPTVVAMPRAFAGIGETSEVSVSATMGVGESTDAEKPTPGGTRRPRSTATVDRAGTFTVSGSSAPPSRPVCTVATAGESCGFAMTSVSVRPAAIEPFGNCQMREVLGAPSERASPRRPSVPSSTCDCSATTRPAARRHLGPDERVASSLIVDRDRDAAVAGDDEALELTGRERPGVGQEARCRRSRHRRRG